MEYFLLITSFCLLIIGILGSLLPILPGPPISWVGLLLLYLTKGIETNYWVLGVTLFIALFVVVLDYIIPAKGTKRFGGSKYGVWGTNVGLVIGLFFPPIGFIIGAFLGALIGELIYDNDNKDRAFKAATGSFLGFLAGTLIKLIVSIAYLVLFFSIVWKNKSIWF